MRGASRFNEVPPAIDALITIIYGRARARARETVNSETLWGNKSTLEKGNRLVREKFLCLEIYGDPGIEFSREKIDIQ